MPPEVGGRGLQTLEHLPSGNERFSGVTNATFEILEFIGKTSYGPSRDSPPFLGQGDVPGSRHIVANEWNR